MADEIRQCRKGKSCCSLWCPRCRHRYAKHLQQRILDQILKPFGEDYDAAFTRLRHVTVLSEVVPLSEKDWRLQQAIRSDRQRFNAVKRAFPKVRYQGAYELELIDFQLLMSSAASVKKRTITSIMEFDQGISDHLIPKQVLVHSHSLWDLGPYDASLVRDCVVRQFATHAPYRVEFDRIHLGQPFDELSFKLGSYPFKDRVQYNLRFETQGYKHGPYFSDRDLARFALLYKRLSVNGFKTLLLGSKNKCLSTAKAA